MPADPPIHLPPPLAPPPPPCRVCHVVVGTPGRVCSLLQSSSLVTRDVAMFVLDEADCLLSDGFYSDVTFIYDQLPRRKQVGVGERGGAMEAEGDYGQQPCRKCMQGEGGGARRRVLSTDCQTGSRCVCVCGGRGCLQLVGLQQVLVVGGGGVGGEEAGGAYDQLGYHEGSGRMC